MAPICSETIARVLPTNLVAHEQGHIFTVVNNLLSQCAFDFMARYQFPILINTMRLVETPQREWAEW
jgi:hypothetical protein